MKDLLSYIAEHLVDNPEEVHVEEIREGDAVTLQLRVAQPDMGKVIGRQGRIATELRVLARAAGNRENVKVSVDILD